MKRTQTVWTLILFACLLGGLLAAGYALAGHAVAKGAFDAITPDGNFERLNTEIYAASRPWIGGLGAGLLALAAYMLLARERSLALVGRGLEAAGAYGRALKADTRSYFNELWAARPRGWELATLVAILLIGATLRALLLDRPLQHDEAYTFIAFAGRDLRHAIGDYHLPNNHVFHSLLQHLSIRLFGEAPWALRLPAYLAGVALIPAAYAAGRLAFNRWAGLAAAGLVAGNMHLIHYSSEARGYILVGLIGVVLWILAMQLLRQPNRFAWLLLTVLAALGFWALPTMLYPYGGVMAWMALTWLLQDRGQNYPTLAFWRDFLRSGLISAALTLLLYSPIFANWGFAAVFNNGVVAGMYDEKLSEFFQNVGARWGDAWTAWNEGLWPALMALSLLFFLVALLSQWRVSRWKAPLPLVMVTFVLSVMLVQRVVGWVRVWNFALPFFLVYAGAGVALLAGWLSGRRSRWRAALLLLTVGAFGLSVGSWIFRPGDNAAELLGAPGEIERASHFLSQQVEGDDVIAVISPDAPAFWYYTRQLEIPIESFEVLRQDLDHAYVVLNTESGHTVEGVLEVRNALLDRVDLQADELLYSSRVIEIHRLPIVR